MTNNFCMISENCETCSLLRMQNFARKFGEIGFTKSDMKKELGSAFCEQAWRRWVTSMSKMVSPTYHFVKELGEWYES